MNALLERPDVLAESFHISSYRPSVLLVDDNPVDRTIYLRHLSRYNVAVRIACNGREATRKWAQRPSLIIMDCYMPTMDGFEAARAIRRIERNSGLHTPIVALTSASESGVWRACARAGMDGFLSKPTRVEAVAEVLRYWVPQLFGSFNHEDSTELGAAQFGPWS